MSTIKLLKEQLELFENSINSSLSNIKERLISLESSSVSFATEKDEIINQIARTGNVITEANNKVAKEIKDDILEIKNVVINRLLEDNRKLRNRLRSLETSNIATEKRINMMEQHSRKVNLEIDGIPDAIEQKDLKSYVVDILRHAEVDPVSTDDIEVVHRLNSKKTPKTTIIRAKRDFLEKVYAKKKIMRSVGKNKMNVASTFYVNESLSTSSKTLAFNCRKLKKAGLITDTWYSNGKIKLKTLDNNIKVIYHEYDLFNLFSDFKEFSFNTSRFLSSDDTDMESYGDLDGY